MIDKVELRVQGFTPYSPEFSRLYQEIRNDPRGPFRPSRHYIASGDLRKYGHPAILHTHSLHDKHGNHKLELIETGKMTYVQMRQAIHGIFDVDTGPLELMRVDLAADVVGVPVSWFEKYVRAQYKRWTAEIGSINPEGQFSTMGKSGVETFYLGKRPNVIRIYNKIAERRGEYMRLKRRALTEAKTLAMREPMGTPFMFLFPSFEQMFGYPETGFILTRVERQIAGGRVPEQLSTFARLRAADEFDPFEKLVFLDGGKLDPNQADYDFPTYCMGMQTRQLIQEQGFHRTKQLLNQRSPRNAARILRRVADFLPQGGDLLTSKGLLERYQQSVSKQLAA
jgi:hypothetical protein